ncbi:MAG: type VII secretion target [Actinocatenispora sp.]
MGDTVRIDPSAVAHLAGQVLTASEQLDDGLQAAGRSSAVPSSAFGNTAGAAGVHRAYQDAVDALGTASGRLVEVLQGDTDRLYRVAFSMRQTDDDNARTIDPAHPHGR